MQNAIDILLADHRKLAAMLANLRTTKDSQQVTAFADALVAHMAIAEEVRSPAFSLAGL